MLWIKGRERYHFFSITLRSIHSKLRRHVYITYIHTCMRAHLYCNLDFDHTACSPLLLAEIYPISWYVCTQRNNPQGFKIVKHIFVLRNSGTHIFAVAPHITVLLRQTPVFLQDCRHGLWVRAESISIASASLRC
jgi:hypothetical protein